MIKPARILAFGTLLQIATGLPLQDSNGNFLPRLNALHSRDIRVGNLSGHANDAAGYKGAAACVG